MITGLFSRESIALGMPPGDQDDREGQILDRAARLVLGDWYEERGVDVRADLEEIGRIAEIIRQQRDLSYTGREGALGRRLSIEMDGIQERFSRDLATTRGWTPARSHFTFDELATGRRREHGQFRRQLIEPDHGLIDHPERFREPHRPFRPAAILTHSYSGGDPAPLLKLAASSGLAVEILPWSWYFPGACTAALFTRPPTWRQAPSRQESERARSRELTQQMRQLRKNRGGRA